MGKVVVGIEYAGRNFGAYIPSLPGVVTVGDTLEEVKENMREALDGHLRVMAAEGMDVPAAFAGAHEFEYKLSTEAFLQAYRGVFKAPALSRITGINARQLWNYGRGLAKPQAAQRARIERGIHQLAAELESITL